MNARVLNEQGWPCPTGDEMNRIDRDAIERLALPARLLMENAGRAVAAALRQRFPSAQRPLVVCGGGNNGGDGFVVARVLRDWDDRCNPVVLALGEGVRRSPEAQANLELLLNSDVEVIVGSGSKEIEACLARCDLVVDAVFGVGLQRPVEGALAHTLQTLRGCALPVLAVDLPSGISSDSGAVLGVELEAELIVTLGLPKLGLALRPFDCEIWVADIGLPRQAIEACGVRQYLLTREAVGGWLPERPAAGHKGSFGHVLVAAGSEGKTGAGTLAAQGALRAGAGLVTAAVPRSLNPIFEIKLTEAMTLPLEDGGTGRLDEAVLDTLLSEAHARDVLVLGPGLGVHEGTVRLLERLLPELRIPVVIDADGLNAFAGRPQALRAAGSRILTPHPGEAARLLECSSREIQADRVSAARLLAERAQAVVLLKGARSVVASPEGEVHVVHSGGPGLASGGTGDVLSGVIGGLLAQGMPPLAASSAGAFLHGLAGDLGPSAGGTAGEVAERIPQAWRELESAVALTRASVEGSGVLHRLA